ncbi:MAG TPA: PAS domain S-box protein [Methylosinus sp.]
MHSETDLCLSWPTGVDEDLRASGIESVGALPWGAHFCQLYDTVDELLEILVPFLAAGLAARELCVWAVSAPLDVETATVALRRIIPDLDARLAAGHIEIMPSDRFFFRDGPLDPGGALEPLESKLDAAFARGFEGMRIAGNLIEAGAEDRRHIAHCEKRLRAFVSSRRILSVCAHPLSCRGADEALEIIARHDFALMRRNGRWEVIKNLDAHRARGALRESEEHFRLMTEGAPETVVFTLDAKGRITSWNKAAQRICGWSAAEVIGRNVALFYPEERRARARRELTLADAHCGYAGDGECLRKDRSVFPIETRIAPLRDDRGRLRGFAWTMRDVSARKRAEREAMASQAHLRAIVESALDGIVTFDGTGVMLSVNSAASGLFGYEARELIGRRIDMILPDPFGGDENELLSDLGSIAASRELIGRREDGATFPVELTISEAPVDGGHLFIGFLRDLSERRRAETQLRRLRADRLDLMAQMAAGVAHEISQPLAAVSAYLGTVRRLLQRRAQGAGAGAGIDVDGILASAVSQVMRAAQIVGHLRGFVNSAEPDKTLQSLHRIIDDACSTAELGRHGGNVAVTLDLAASNDRVIIDCAQMRQVLINLLRNAMEAMQGSDKRELAISTRLVEGGMIRADIADTGAGLSDELAHILFEPFVTTKTHGLGVGLAVSRSIVEAHHGRLWAEANPGGGAILCFTLPLAGEHCDARLIEE